jgi:hypothetical protein
MHYYNFFFLIRPTNMQLIEIVQVGIRSETINLHQVRLSRKLFNWTFVIYERNIMITKSRCPLKCSLPKSDKKNCFRGIEA